MGDRLTSKRLANLCNDNMFIQLDSKMDRQEFSMLAYDAPKYPEIYKRLAEYEDIGTVEELKRLKEIVKELKYELE